MKPADDNPRHGNLEMANAFKLVAESLINETDRGTVVLATAWLDESLTAILRTYMKPSEKADDLFSPGRPLGDFGTKIILADRLRLVAPSMIRSLEIIRKLRNEFAHIASDLTFETQSVKDRVQNVFRENEDLLLVMGETLIEKGMSFGQEDDLSIEHMLKRFGTRALFQYTCAFLNGALALVKFHLKPAEPQFSFEELEP
ncbi:hypothetical protein [Pseudomonas sp. URIL14HWK12:I5]|uniref:hypothetical protein n=1 Tax=Pseudomonas sp. URIL14HWK12:I5 TaxID=1261630 RepID=UPI0009D84307|nr:hypothetical protein [Pseudomonas sp. URIL14HWK12:I5]SMC69463.1 hypothetical protein SAMN05660385_02042 [Pseudomonas sp. URIL14HWK12:I5]